MQAAQGFLPLPGCCCLYSSSWACASHVLAPCTSAAPPALLLPNRDCRFASRPATIRPAKLPELHAFASLGFTADPRPSIERVANGLLKDAASLLVYQDVLRVHPAQAFLKVLLALRRGEDGWKLLDAYGEFFKLMAAGHFSSWEDLLLEGILGGEGNPFAEASANVGNPGSRWCKGVPPSLQAAAAADLDSLQRLSITERTLVGWVIELVPDVKQEWRTAAESTLDNHQIKNAQASLDEHLPRNLDSLRSDREAWRKKIGGLWRWSEAVPLLQEYYAKHGIGRTACEQVLHCRGGKLLQHSGFYMYEHAWNLSIHQAFREELAEAFERHGSGFGANHILILGPAGSGKTWLVLATLYKLVVKGTVKVIMMSKGELKHLQAVLEELAKSWRLRFVIVADGISSSSDFSYLDWPDNVLLCATCTCSSLSEAEEAGSKRTPILPELSDTFSISLHLEALNMDSFLLTVQEFLDHDQASDRQLEGIREQAVPVVARKSKEAGCVAYNQKMWRVRICVSTFGSVSIHVYISMTACTDNVSWFMSLLFGIKLATCALRIPCI